MFIHSIYVLNVLIKHICFAFADSFLLSLINVRMEFRCSVQQII